MTSTECQPRVLLSRTYATLNVGKSAVLPISGTGSDFGQGLGLEPPELGLGAASAYDAMWPVLLLFAEVEEEVRLRESMELISVSMSMAPWAGYGALMRAAGCEAPLSAAVAGSSGLRGLGFWSWSPLGQI